MNERDTAFAMQTALAKPYKSKTKSSSGMVLKDIDALQHFASLIRDDEREQITSEWWSVVQGDLENGVKSLNEQAALKWRKEYPSMASFGEWLETKWYLNG